MFRLRSAAFDRFRFNLGLSAEAATKADAMKQLNRELPHDHNHPLS